MAVNKLIFTQKITSWHLWYALLRIFTTASLKPAASEMGSRHFGSVACPDSSTKMWVKWPTLKHRRWNPPAVTRYYDDTILGSNIYAVCIKAAGLYGSGWSLSLDGIQSHHFSHSYNSTLMETLRLQEYRLKLSNVPELINAYNDI